MRNLSPTEIPHPPLPEVYRNDQKWIYRSKMDQQFNRATSNVRKPSRSHYVISCTLVFYNFKKKFDPEKMSDSKKFLNPKKISTLENF